jgi:twitching motility protein PilT
VPAAATLAPTTPVAAPVAPVAAAQSPAPASVAQTQAAPPSAAAASPRDTSEIDAFFHTMVEQGCSDLHISTNSPPMVRKDGAMALLGPSEPLPGPRVLEILYPIASDIHRKQFEERNDVDFAYEIAGLGRFRCNFFRDRHGAGAVFRVIPTDILTADQLGLSDAILNFCDLTKGLVVVTGPTGSGKSTTLAAMIDHINKTRADHVITIEDPIEFVHKNQKCLINQREIGTHTDGFKPALRAALREDPDIVLVGEMRDLETIEIAIETAETGHLVFGTLHTNTAASTVDRIIDQFPTDRQEQIRTMLSGSLRGVVAQTLCKKTSGGRVAALEVLVVTAAVSNLIREGKTFQIPSIIQTSRKLGMVTMSDALIELVQEGVIAPEEALRRAVDQGEFARAAKAKGIDLPVAAEGG